MERKRNDNKEKRLRSDNGTNEQGNSREQEREV